MGKVYVEKRDTNQARAEFERSLAVMPDYLPTLQNITDFDILETNFAQAHQRLASVIERDPKSADLYAMQGKVYFYQKQTNQAEAAYSKAIELNHIIGSRDLIVSGNGMGEAMGQTGVSAGKITTIEGWKKIAGQLTSVSIALTHWWQEPTTSAPCKRSGKFTSPQAGMTRLAMPTKRYLLAIRHSGRP